VQHDTEKVEEYYGRAILGSPEDVEVLSLYAKFTWETHNEAARAQLYFGPAVKAAPNDCYVLSSYGIPKRRRIRTMILLICKMWQL